MFGPWQFFDCRSLPAFLFRSASDGISETPKLVEEAALWIGA
jgi:hypothetical protein